MILIQDFQKMIKDKCREAGLMFSEILDSQDLVNISSPLTKITAARICHNALQIILKEKDEENWSAAWLLHDIYDCHTCVPHIAQTYAKGIIEPVSTQPLIFGHTEQVSEEQGRLYAERLFNPNLRLKIEHHENNKIKYISEKSAKSLFDVKIIDLAAGPLSLKEINQNPYSADPDLGRNIALKCKKGYQSTLAANILLKAGFINIYVIL